MSAGTDSQTSSQFLSSSHSSLSHSKKASSEISKTYKHASQLYLTRRLSEAYEALQPIIRPPIRTDDSAASDDDVAPLSPIAIATTSQRIKIWSLYATLLNAIVDLGSDEGRREFGLKEHREIVRSVQSGEVWEQVIRDGYQGRDGSVDAEVVYNLSTLLLGQASDQTLNQSRLESYLASSVQPDMDLSLHLHNSLSNGRHSHINGADTPKDLTSRIKILELFTLHVLPRNEEWDYAKSFITNSDVLDEERKEAFLQTLEELQDVREHDQDGFEDAEEAFDQEVTQRVRQDVDRQSRLAVENTLSPPPERNGTLHRRTSSEVDYGIEKAHPNGLQAAPSTTAATNGNTPNRTSKTAPTILPPKPLASSPSPRPNSHTNHLSPPSQTPRRPSTRKPASKSSRSNTLMSQARQLFLALSQLARNMASSVMDKNATQLFRTLLFMVAFLMLVSRRDVRDRVSRVVGTGWQKVRGTVGMGVKVSYI